MKTERGISTLRWSILLALAMQGAAAAMLVPFSVARASLMGALSEPVVVALAPLIVAMYVLGLLATISFFVGLVMLYQGRLEFGPIHSKNVERVVVLAVAALVLGVTAFGLSLTLGILPSGLTVGSPELPGALGASAVISGARGVFVSLAFVSGSKALVTGADRRIGTLAIVGLASAPAVGTLALYMALPAGPGGSSFSPLGFFGAGVEGVVGLLGYGALYRIYAKTLERLRAP